MAAMVAIAHGGQIRRNFNQPHWEDFRFFRHNRAVVATWTDCFTQPGAWPGLYRPLTTNCYYYAGRRLWRNQLEVYHAINVALFTINGVLVWVLASRLLPRGFDLVPPLLFVSREAHVQVLRYTSEFQALFSTFFGLVALLFMLGPRGTQNRRAEPLALFAFILAFLGKETIAIVPLLALAYALLFPPRPSLRAPVIALGVAAAFLAFRPFVLQAIGTERATGFDYDLSGVIVYRYAAYALDFSNALIVGVVNVETPEAVLALARQPVFPALVTVLIAATAVTFLAVHRRSVPQPERVAAFGMAWFFIAAMPFVVLRDRLFMRYSYLPHVGLALAIGALAVAARDALVRFRAPRRGAGDPTSERAGP